MGPERVQRIKNLDVPNYIWKIKKTRRFANFSFNTRNNLKLLYIFELNDTNFQTTPSSDVVIIINFKINIQLRNDTCKTFAQYKTTRLYNKHMC